MQVRRARKGEGARERERPLMAAISDALAIRHFDCAAGSTVERPFLEAVAGCLGVDGSREAHPSKESLLEALLERVGSSDPAGFASTGGTVTNRALAELLEGALRNGLERVSLTDGAPAVRIALALFENGAPEEVFDPLELSDERKRALRYATVREGQGKFRSVIVNAYDGRCAITGCDVPEVLEAAHIRPHRGPRTNRAVNGILLRSDLHRLWDTGLLAIHESGYGVLLAAHLVDTDYALLAGQRIRLPRRAEQIPSSAALEQQRLWARL